MTASGSDDLSDASPPFTTSRSTTAIPISGRHADVRHSPTRSPTAAPAGPSLSIERAASFRQ